MGCALGLVLALAVGALIFLGLGSTVEEIENETHPIAQDVKMAASSIGFPLLLIVVVVGIVIFIAFIVSSMQAFGGP